MTKVTLDMNTFKALASDSRLDILKVLDGKKMSLNDISKKTKLNKATLHEHLAKLNEAGLVKRKERDGHKWVYYKLTWKGECLLHPENTKIVVMFSVTFVTIFVAVMFFVSFAQPIIIGMAETYGDTTYLYEVEDKNLPVIHMDNTFNVEKSSESTDYATYANIDRNLVGTVNATNITLKDLNYQFQQQALPTNYLGMTYNEEQIEWYSTSKELIAPAQSVLKCTSSPTKNWTDNATRNEINDSEYNDSIYLGDSGNIAYDCYEPAVPEMIAIVYDPSLLYIGVSCILFAIVLFTISTWRLIKNRKQKF